MTTPTQFNTSACVPGSAVAALRYPEPTPTNIRELVNTFYERVRADALLGPVFERALHGRWDDHLPKMSLFWGSLALGDKRYRGNVQKVHEPLEGIEPRHFSRWLQLFLHTVSERYEPAAAMRFMEPALRIAQSLQLSHFGWDYEIPAEQQMLLERVTPKRRGEDEAHEPHAGVREARRGGRYREPFPAKIIGSGVPEGEDRDDRFAAGKADGNQADAAVPDA
jgi:hemoglobin